MALDHSLIGEPGEPSERSWTSADALLYAVGCGAGLGDPLQELEFTTENSEGVTQQVLPTYGVLLAQSRRGRRLGDFDPALLVHAEQAFELHRPLPVERHGADRGHRHRDVRQGVRRRWWSPRPWRWTRPPASRWSPRGPARSSGARAGSAATAAPVTRGSARTGTRT